MGLCDEPVGDLLINLAARLLKSRLLVLLLATAAAFFVAFHVDALLQVNGFSPASSSIVGLVICGLLAAFSLPLLGSWWQYISEEARSSHC